MNVVAPSTLDGFPQTSESAAQSACAFPEVKNLCQRLDLESIVDSALNLVVAHLKPERIQVESANDPEGDREWLVIRADVRGSVEDVLNRYSACKKDWLRLAPPAKREAIRFLYNIL